MDAVLQHHRLLPLPLLLPQAGQGRAAQGGHSTSALWLLLGKMARRCCASVPHNTPPPPNSVCDLTQPGDQFVSCSSRYFARSTPLFFLAVLRLSAGIGFALALAINPPCQLPPVSVFLPGLRLLHGRVSPLSRHRLCGLRAAADGVHWRWPHPRPTAGAGGRASRCGEPQLGSVSMPLGTGSASCRCSWVRPSSWHCPAARAAAKAGSRPVLWPASVATANSPSTLPPACVPVLQPSGTASTLASSPATAQRCANALCSTWGDRTVPASQPALCLSTQPPSMHGLPKSSAASAAACCAWIATHQDSATDSHPTARWPLIASLCLWAPAGAWLFPFGTAAFVEGSCTPMSPPQQAQQAQQRQQGAWGTATATSRGEAAAWATCSWPASTCSIWTASGKALSFLKWACGKRQLAGGNCHWHLECGSVFAPVPVPVPCF